MSDMPRETLTANSESLTGGMPARDLGPGEVAKMFGPAPTPRQRLEGQVIEFVKSETEMGGGGEGYTEDEMRLIRQWKKEQILSGAASLDGELRVIRDRINAGEVLSKPEIFRLRDGRTVEVTLGDRLKGLLLARMIWYPTAKEAALALRENEGIVRQEIDEYQALEGGVGASSRPLATGLNKAGGVPYTEGDYFVKLSETQKLVENPPELQEFRKTLEALGKEYGNEYLRRMAKRFRRHELVGLMPDTRDLPLFVPFEKALNELRRLAPERDGRSLIDELKAMEEMAEEERRKHAEQFGLGARQEIGGEYYIGMYQEAWDEFCEALITFPPEVQDEIVANYIIGGSMMGGQYPAFYRKGVEQRGRFPSKWTPWLNAIEHFQKTSSIEGYIPPEQIFQALGSVKPEVLAFPDSHTSRHEIWLAGEDRPRKFSLSSRDMIGQLGRIDTLARLGANNAYTSETGFFAVRNGEFAEYLFRQMGFSPEMARKIAYEKAEAPTLIRDSRLSPTRRREITNIWDWVGETALDKLIVPMAWLKWARADVEFLPLDLKRRQILSLRGLEMADYRLGYSLGLPPEQFLNMISLFGSALSLDHKEMLAWVSGRFNSRGESGNDLEKRRQSIWESTISLERPSLASSRHLARMALGLGEYNLTGDDYRKKTHERIGKIPSSRVVALRHPDLWKWKWYSNADKDTSKWRYIGDFVGGPSETQVRSAFSGYDFTEELRACGLSKLEIQGMQSVGYEGWKNLLANATLGLMEWKKMGYTTGDKTWRYEKKKDVAQEAAIAFLEISSSLTPKLFRSVGSPQPDAGLYQDVGGNSCSYEYVQQIPYRQTEKDVDAVESGRLADQFLEKLGKIVESLSSTPNFVTNAIQASWVEALFMMYIDGHAAHKLDAYVEEVDPSKSDGGDNWKVKVITRDKIDPSRIDSLQTEGFYFVHLPDTSKEEDILISPLGAPLPRLIKAGELLEKIKIYAEKQIESGRNIDRNAYLLRATRLMKDEKHAFCWDTLVNSRSDLPPVTILDTLLTLGEEGILNAATADTVKAEILRFAGKYHPRGARKLGKEPLDKVPTLY